MSRPPPPPSFGSTRKASCVRLSRLDVAALPKLIVEDRACCGVGCVVSPGAGLSAQRERTRHCEGRDTHAHVLVHPASPWALGAAYRENRSPCGLCQGGRSVRGGTHTAPCRTRSSVANGEQGVVKVALFLGGSRDSSPSPPSAWLSQNCSCGRRPSSHRLARRSRSSLGCSTALLRDPAAETATGHCQGT